MIGQSQSGTGKTAAFTLTMLSRIDMSKPVPQVRSRLDDRLPSPAYVLRYLSSQPKLVQAICLTPTRELARQNEEIVRTMGQFTPVQTFLGVKDSFDKHSPPLTAQVIVGTPGTILDLIVKKKLDPRDIRVLVLDEADNMLDQQSLGEQTLRVKK